MRRLVVLGPGSVGFLTEEAYLDEARLQRLLEEYPEPIALDEVDQSASQLVRSGGRYR